jgi:hypothetical protein
VDRRDAATSTACSPDRGASAESVTAAERGPLGELLAHLLAEVRQLEHRCCELELLLHDLAIRCAIAGEDPGPARAPGAPRRRR